MDMTKLTLFSTNIRRWYSCNPNILTYHLIYDTAIHNVIKPECWQSSFIQPTYRWKLHNMYNAHAVLNKIIAADRTRKKSFSSLSWKTSALFDVTFKSSVIDCSCNGPWISRFGVSIKARLYICMESRSDAIIPFVVATIQCHAAMPRRLECRRITSNECPAITDERLNGIPRNFIANCGEIRLTACKIHHWAFTGRPSWLLARFLRYLS